MSKIRLFLQYEGDPQIQLVDIDSDAPTRELIAAAVRAGLAAPTAGGCHVFGADSDSPLDLDRPLHQQGLRDKHRVHVHRCHQVDVTFHFNDVTEVVHFPPSATVDRVKKRFVQMIHMSPVDATEHVLQICGTSERPDPDIQIGSLVSGCCTVCFDLVPVKRIEG